MTKKEKQYQISKAIGGVFLSQEAAYRILDGGIDNDESVNFKVENTFTEEVYTLTFEDHEISSLKQFIFLLKTPN